MDIISYRSAYLLFNLCILASDVLCNIVPLLVCVLLLTTSCTVRPLAEGQKGDIICRCLVLRESGSGDVALEQREWFRSP